MYARWNMHGVYGYCIASRCIRAKALKKTPESDSEDVVMEDVTSSVELQDSLHSLAKRVVISMLHLQTFGSLSSLDYTVCP